jgi:hypothetical protein
MKRLVVLVTALCVVAIAVPAAQTAPTSEQGCALEHLSAAECQGPDLNPAADFCNISTWVGNASCELTVADGVANTASGFVEAFAELQDTNWHAEFHMVVRDKTTGQVLFSRDGSSTLPVSQAPPVPSARVGFGAPLTAAGGSEVICEVTGTHTPAGAAESAIAAAEGFGQFNNVFRCEVR